MPTHPAIVSAIQAQSDLEKLDEQRTQLIRTRAVHLMEAVQESGLNPREIGEYFNVGRQRIYQMVEQGGYTMPSLRKHH